MGCFLGCFGLKTKKKSRRARKKSPSQEQNIGSYVPLDSHLSIIVHARKNNVSSDSSHLKEKPKEPMRSKSKKKVSFNLNVKTYEPIPKEDHTIDYLSEGEEETRWEFDNREVENLAGLHYGEDYSNSIATNYRYKNWRDGYDEDDDELKLDENDLSFDESSDVSAKESDDGIECQENLNWESNPLESHGRRYLHSVLNPVENLAQWKMAKGETKNGFAKFSKENLDPKQGNETKSRFVESRQENRRFVGFSTFRYKI